MSASELITQCKTKGITLTANGDRLQVDSLLPVDAETRAALARFKSELLALLAEQASTVPTEPKGLLITAYTPAGNPVTVLAKDADHAEWIRKMNPSPETLAAIHIDTVTNLLKQAKKRSNHG